MTLNNLNNPRALWILTFLCPPLAVSVKEGKFKSLKVCMAVILTLLLWIPGMTEFEGVVSCLLLFLGVLYAYLNCLKAGMEAESQEITDTASVAGSQGHFASKLYNPTPIHPKANQIIAFPVTLSSVVIHVPLDGHQEFRKEPFEMKNKFNSNLQECMV